MKMFKTVFPGYRTQTIKPYDILLSGRALHRLVQRNTAPILSMPPTAKNIIK